MNIEETKNSATVIQNAMDRMAAIWESPEVTQARERIKGKWERHLANNEKHGDTFAYLEHVLYGGNDFQDFVKSARDGRDGCLGGSDAR